MLKRYTYLHLFSNENLAISRVLIEMLRGNEPVVESRGVEKRRFRVIVSHTAATISSHVLTHPVTLKKKLLEK